VNKIFSEIDKQLKLAKAKFLGGRGRDLSYKRLLLRTEFFSYLHTLLMMTKAISSKKILIVSALMKVMLGNCAEKRSYEYTEGDVNKIFFEIEK